MLVEIWTPYRAPLFGVISDPDDLRCAQPAMRVRKVAFQTLNVRISTFTAVLEVARSAPQPPVIARLRQASPRPHEARHNDRVAVHPIVQAKRAEIAALCRELGVLRLDVFGSAVTEDFDLDRSDVDVLVETEPGRLTLAEYFALQTGLQRSLGRDVDILDPRMYLWDAPAPLRCWHGAAGVVRARR
jgi:hypothetical protein